MTDRIVCDRQGVMLKIRVLGPLFLADRQGRPCTPQALKLRVLLGKLLVEHGRVVTTRRLTDDLWAGGPPRTVRTGLQVYISNLRRLLRSASLSPDVATIVTHPSGYMLEVDRSEFDLPQLEAALENSRRAQERGEMATASRLLSEALALWQGPALADIATTPELVAEARRLDELRLSMYERRIRVDMALGRENDMIGELYALTAEYPMHERLCALLMTALHNQGRPADALKAFSDLRRTMRTQLGLEPGHALQELQRVVLSRGAIDLSFMYGALSAPG